MSGKGFAANSGGASSRGSTNADAKSQKLAKQSVFEKQKAEAEAKRLREAAETKAVYEDFVKSFDRDDDYDDDHHHGGSHNARQDGAFNSSSRGGPPRHGFGGGSRRHFGASSSGLKSGPGSLGPAPSAFGKKRSFQDFNRSSPASSSRDRSGVGFEDHRIGLVPPPPPQGGASLSKAFATSDDDEDMAEAQDREEEKAVARPTLRLSNVPPGTSPATIKAMLPSNLAVDNVRLLPPAPGAGTERKSLVVIVTMSPETPATDLDAAVSALQNRYMGYGYYLALHRHLSSAVASSAALPNLGSSSGSHPFGAKPVEQQGAEARGKSTHHQQGFHRGFAPPTSYGPNYVAVNRANILHVPVRPPQDVRAIQLINMVIEGLLEHGPEFEALLMSRPEVQREERWAWLWDARSEGGIWLRWRLWEVVTGSQPKAQRGKYVPLFDGAHAWKSPDKPLPFEYTTRLEDFVSDSEYNSSDEEDVEDEANNNNNGGGGNRDGEEGGRSFLNPLDKAKLTHLLARLPTTLGRLRKGDVARITAFAIMHASRGVYEVVDMMITNIETPFSLASANLERERDRERERATAAATVAAAPGEEGPPDLSGASLIGLYVINDVLSSSSTSGVRHAWRYRQLIEGALRSRGTFGWLGRMAERQGWGRLRADKWKRSVGLVLHLWEGWCVFPAASQALFARSFESPPSLRPPEGTAGAETAQDGGGEAKDGRWKLVEAKSEEAEDKGEEEQQAGTQGEPIEEDDVEGEPIVDDDVEGEAIDEDDIEGEPIEDDDIAGTPMDEEDVAGEPMDEDEAAPATATETGQARRGGGGSPPEPSPSGTGFGLQPRRRMRAADMFADSGEDSD
ncbi:RNA polymerase II, large subunit, CTD [Cordyceps javanica]|uniref:RNA polymerase II, large subunit, CTD n=1 Tax=Cordyceps javanica TaxID=43265 RepID=A0A545W5K5_9HYPO|nr:RNA polymerase II, large subunit, CTD [Cordyceps javanica]TQW09261.1 RNA polymerase II, large subunit, CTD [Cordyceps javanica]